MEMNYCMHCGQRLEERFLESEEKLIPFCPRCEDYRFPVFNTAVSMIVRKRGEDRYLLIKQYGRARNVLVAGYINKGEDAEAAVARELKEEMGLEAVNIRFNHSHYFAPSNTLMLNFLVEVDDETVCTNAEVDAYDWYTEDEAREAIVHNSLAECFLLGYLDGVYKFDYK